MQATRTTFIPLLVSAHSDRVDPAAVRDEAFAGLGMVYSHGPDYGRRVVTHGDLSQLQLHPQALRQVALQHLEVLSSRAEFHGQPPALMLSFEGLESSLLLASDFWARLEGAVPGELIVGVPSRDCVVVTGSRSGPGLEKAKRCVERVFFAGGGNLISRGLFVRRGGVWEPFDRTARPSGRPQFGPAHLHGVGQPPRQYQEHPSWPGGERIPPQGHAPRQGVPVRRRPMYDVPPALLDQTGQHRLDQTGGPRFDQTGGGPRFDQTGSGPRFDQTGGMPRPDQTGGMSRYDTGGMPRFDQTGGQPRHDTGGMPRYDQTGGLQRLDQTGYQPVSRQAEPGYYAPAYHAYEAEVAEAAQYSAVPYANPRAEEERELSERMAAFRPGMIAAYPSAFQAPEPTPAPPAPPSYSTGTMPRVRDEPSYGTGTMPRVRDEPPYSTGTMPRVRDEPSYGTGTMPRVRDEPPYSTGTMARVRDEPYGTGTMPRVRDDRAYGTGTMPRVRDEPAVSYPDAWGLPPETAKSEFPTGPRARFS